jgi:subtilisin family serine protease
MSRLTDSLGEKARPFRNPFKLIMGLTEMKGAIIIGLLFVTAVFAGSPVISDPLFEQQSALFEKLGVLEAWESTKGSSDVLIGVIDSGFDFFHPDLELIPGFYASGGYHPETYVNIAHGTLVASIIGAKINGVGMVGLAPECRILTASHGVIEHKLLKLQQEFLKNNPDATLSEWQEEIAKHAEELEEWGNQWTTYTALSIAEAIRYLVDHGVRVINISAFLSRQLIPEKAWDELEKAFEYAEDNDVIIVLGAGNNAMKCEDYPGGELTIVAGATLLNDERWEEEVEFMGQKIKQGSNYGKITVMAPVENLTVCAPHEERFYSWEDGPMGSGKLEFEDAYDILSIGATSSAAPVVTSLIALVYSLRPDLDARSVVEIIKQGCDDIGEQGYDMYTGWGRVNFAKTLEIAEQAGESSRCPACVQPFADLLSRLRI